MAGHYTKIIAGQVVTQGMVKCLRDTMDLAMEVVSIPEKYKGVQLRGIRLSQDIADAKEPPASATTFLDSPDFLLHSLSQQNVDEKKIQEVLKKLEQENKALQEQVDQQGSSNATEVGNFMWNVKIVRPDAQYTSARVQLDTGSPDSFVSEAVVRKARLPRMPAAESIFLTLNGEQVAVKEQVSVEWYALNQAVTRVTMCYVMPNLPVDMLVGSDHIIEYNLLAIHRAKGAFIAMSNATSKKRAAARAAANDKDKASTYWKDLWLQVPALNRTPPSVPTRTQSGPPETMTPVPGRPSYSRIIEPQATPTTTSQQPGGSLEAPARPEERRKSAGFLGLANPFFQGK